MSLIATKLYTHFFEPSEINGLSYIWEKETIPFDELIISWNAQRPQKGHFVFSVSFKKERWSEWLPYAYWGRESQKSTCAEYKEWGLKINCDTITLLDGKTVNKFKICIEACEGATLDSLFSLNASVRRIGDHIQTINTNFMEKDSIDLDVPLLSQLALPHPRCTNMCSPASTTSVLRYLLKTQTIDPLTFAEKVLDAEFNIYGNWTLNIAQASSFLGKAWLCSVRRLSGFEDIYYYLKEGIPVIVSVKGPLPGSIRSYEQGHLVVVKGFDAAQRKVLCMDPAFLTDNATNISYPFDAFLNSWKRRHYTAYTFQSLYRT